MQYRRFGRTELTMPVLTCGGMRYQHKWQDIPWSTVPEAGQANVEAVVKTALEAGITHIETARGYGSSEMQLGRILPTLPRDRLIVQTKVSPKQPKVFRQDFETSLRYLRLDHVDLLSLHGINTLEHLRLSLAPGGCLDLARQWVAQGKVRFIGFSTHGPLEVILAAIATDAFDYLNLHWYYINQINWPAIAAAKARDMGVFIISPSDKGGKLYQPPAKLVELCAPLSPIAFNDLFCLSHPEVHTLSIGAARPSDFAEHCRAVALLDQADTLLPTILARLEQALVDACGEHWAKTWQEGLPTYDQVPGQVNIRTILWLRNLVLAYDLTDYARGRYNLLGNGSHWFPGENAVRVDPQSLAACLANSPHRHVIPDYLQEAHHLLAGGTQQRLSQSV